MVGLKAKWTDHFSSSSIIKLNTDYGRIESRRSMQTVIHKNWLNTDYGRIESEIEAVDTNDVDVLNTDYGRIESQVFTHSLRFIHTVKHGLW